LRTAPPSSDASHPLLIVLSGPSGVGKDAVISRMRELKKPYHFVVTVTTRPQRATERNGVDYTFVATEAFHQMIERRALLEWAKVYGNLYGVPKLQVGEALKAGRDVFIKADVQGAATISKLAPEAISIFLAPPSMDELARRLSCRMTESSEAFKLRLETATAEMQEAPNFDYVVVNHQEHLDDTVEEIESIVARERSRTPPRNVCLLEPDQSSTSSG